MKAAPAQQSRYRPSRDAVVVVAVTLASFVLASVLDVQERIAHLTQPLERFQVDELPLILVVLALMLVWYAWRRRRQAAAAERALADALAENRRLSQMVLLAQEDERRKLARELHDELGQCLNAIKIDATAIRDDARSPPEVVGSAKAIVEVSNRVYDATRGLMQRLRPVALDELGLADALRHLAGEWGRRNAGVRCALELEGDFEGLSEQANITLYRVVQECLTNVARHAKATSVGIALERADGELRVCVRDDGVGFAAGGARPGFGLAGLRERVAALEGRLDVLAGAPCGVEVRASIPVGAAAR